MPGQAGVKHAADLPPRGQEFGNALGVLAAAFQPQRQRANGAQREPRLHGAQDAADQRPPLLDFLQQLPVARGHMAEDDVAVAGHRLGVGGDGEIRAQRQRPLPQRRRRGVVHRDQSARAMRLFAQRGDVADLHGRVAGRLDPQQARAFQVFALRVARGGRKADDDAHLGEVVLHQAARGKVGVGGQHGDVAGSQHGTEDCGTRSHSRGEDQGAGAVALALVRLAWRELARLDLADDALQRGPGGIVRPRVAVERIGRVARRVEGRGEHRPRMKRLARGGASQRGTNDPGRVMHRLGPMINGIAGIDCTTRCVPSRAAGAVAVVRQNPPARRRGHAPVSRCGSPAPRPRCAASLPPPARRTGARSLHRR